MAALPENDRIAGPFIAVAGQTDFPADFPLLKADALRVRRERAGAVTILSGAELSAIDQSGTGFTCRLASPSVAGDLCWIYSRLPAARLRQHTPNGAVRSPTLESDAEEFQGQLQEHRAQLDRSISLPVGVSGGEVPWSPGLGERFLTIGVDGRPQVRTRPADFDGLNKLNRDGSLADLTDPEAALDNLGGVAFRPQTLSALQKGVAKFNIGISYVTPFDKGAAGDGVADDTLAVKAAFADGRPVDLDGGSFVVTEAIMSSDVRVLVSSAGIAGELIFAAGAGGLALEYEDHNHPILISNVRLLTRSRNAGTLLAVTYAGEDAWNNRNVGRCRLEYVELRGENILAHGPTCGLRLTDVHSADIIQPTIAGCRDMGLSGRASFVGMDDGIHIVGTSIMTIPSDHYIEAPRVYNAKRAIRTSGHVEGVLVQTPILVGVGTGVAADMASIRPWVQVKGGHVNAFDYGVHLKNAPQSEIESLLVYKIEFATSDTVAVRLDGCDFSTVKNLRLINQCIDATASGAFHGVEIENSLYGQVSDIQHERGSTTVSVSGSSNPRIGPNIQNHGTYLNGQKRLIHNTSGLPVEIALGDLEVGSTTNVAALTATADGVASPVLDIGDVALGQRFRVFAQVTMVKGATAGDVLASVFQPMGDAGLRWLGGGVQTLRERWDAGAGSTSTIALTGTVKVTAAGQLQLALLCQSLGSDAVIAANDLSLHVEAI